MKFKPGDNVFILNFMVNGEMRSDFVGLVKGYRLKDKSRQVKVWVDGNLFNFDEDRLIQISDTVKGKKHD